MRDYLEFFGFKDDPFKITPDSHYFFLSESHQEALSSLKYLLDSEEGFAVIIGEPGTGKTLTVRKFIDELPEDVEFAYVLFPNLSPEELFEAILEDFGIKTQGETKNRLFGKLRDYLIEKRSKGKRILVIIDEAQNLPVETLEELRILSNLETSDMKLLQIILLGQPELEEKLSSEKLRQLRQRITIISKLRNFSEEETKAYIDYRISKAGRGNVKIHPKSYKLVYRYSLGIPRLINIIMERALMAAFLDSSHEVKPKHVERAVESIGLRLERSKLSRSTVYVAVVTVLLAAFLFLGGRELIGEKTKPTTGVEEQFEEVYVSVPMLNMREGPSTEAEVVYVLREGDRLRVLERGPENWIRVLYSNGDLRVEGWVNGKYVRK